MQKAVDAALGRGRQAGLTSSPAKMVAVLLTRKEIHPLLIWGWGRWKNPLLGITFDLRFEMASTLETQGEVGKGTLKLRNEMGKLWGVVVPPTIQSYKLRNGQKQT